MKVKDLKKLLEINDPEADIKFFVKTGSLVSEEILYSETTDVELGIIGLEFEVPHERGK